MAKLPLVCVGMGSPSEGVISSVLEVSATLRSKVLSLVHSTASSSGIPRITTLHSVIAKVINLVWSPVIGDTLIYHMDANVGEEGKEGWGFSSEGWNS